MKKLIVICATIVLLAGMGAWVYVQRQNAHQKDLQAKSQQELEVKKLKYQECQDNNRAAESSKSIDDPYSFSSLSVKNCDLIL